jgi:hypothetical protein
LRFAFAQRAFCAAAILLRLAAEIVLLGFPEGPLPFFFAHRAFCARLIFLRAAADIPCLLLPCLDSEPRNASATRSNFVISASTSSSILFVSKGASRRVKHGLYSWLCVLNKAARKSLDHADADAPIHAPDERFLEEADEPKGGLRFALRSL